MKSTRKERNQMAKQVESLVLANKQKKKESKKENLSAIHNSMGGKSSNFGMEFTPSKIQTEFKSFFQSVPMKNGASRVNGADIIAVVATGASNFSGTPLTSAQGVGSFLISPFSPQLVGTRLGIEALRFEKYRFKKLRFVFLPDVGTGTNGSVILAFDPDATDNFVNLAPTALTSLNSLQTLMGFEDSVKASVWTPFALDIKTIKSDPQQFYYTNYNGGDLRLAAQGQLWVCSGGSLPNTTSLGSIGIEYEIEFYDPSLDQLNSQVRYDVPASAVDTVPLHGFNAFNTGTVKTTGGGTGLYQLVTDTLGNKYFSIPPGVHQIDSTSTNTSGASGSAPIITYTALANLVSSVVPVVTSLFSGNSGTVIGSYASNKAMIYSPPGGTKLYANISGSTSNLSQFLEIAQWATSLII
jgi:hypothetical protein